VLPVRYKLNLCYIEESGPQKFDTDFTDKSRHWFGILRSRTEAKEFSLVLCIIWFGLHVQTIE
jgi:hypothetical protein